MHIRKMLNRFVFPATMFIFSTSIIGHSAEFVQVGKTYPIAERDAVIEFKEMATEKSSKIKTEANLAGKKAEHDLAQGGSEVSLPGASKTNKRLVDVSFTLDIDIPDPQNPKRVLYPKGFKFNPLQYVTYEAPTILFIDGSDKRQVVWAKTRSGLIRNNGSERVILILTGGGAAAVSRKLGVNATYAQKTLVERLDVRVVPSIVRRAGNMMEVEEIAIPK